jgi:hypothetical protein
VAGWLGVGVGGGASADPAITEGSAVEGEGEGRGARGREQFAGEGAVRGVRAGGTVRGARGAVRGAVPMFTKGCKLASPQTRIAILIVVS